MLLPLTIQSQATLIDFMIMHCKWKGWAHSHKGVIGHSGKGMWCGLIGMGTYV